MEQVHSQIYVTTDYSKFKSIGGNRVLNQLHINRLKQSIKEEYLATRIIVNEKYEIIDGQHRFEVIKELGLPLYYELIVGYGLSEVHRFNQLVKSWGFLDYIKGYADLGYEDYVSLLDFIKRRKFQTMVAITLLGSDASSSTQTNQRKAIYEGRFKIKNIFFAEEIADKIEKLQELCVNAKRRNLVFAIIRLSKRVQFDFEEFLHKLKLQPNSLVDCTTVEKYIELIEEIYNYRRTNKINLRF